MSKIYDKFLELKSANKNKIYIFDAGIFLIFIDEDAKKMSQILNLKLTNLNDKIVKCGFPKSHVDKYVSLLETHNIDFQIIHDLNNSSNVYSRKIIDPIFTSIINKNLDNMSVSEVYNFVEDIQHKIKLITKDIYDK